MSNTKTILTEDKLNAVIEIHELSKALEKKSKAFIQQATRLTEEEAKAIREKPSYYDLINFHDESDAYYMALDNGPFAHVKLPGVTEARFPYHRNNPPTDQQLKEMFVATDEHVLWDNGLETMDECYLAEWLKRPCLYDLEIEHEFID